MAFIVDGAARMKQLIEDLLAYSRVGTRGRESRRSTAARGARARRSPTCARAQEASGAVITPRRDADGVIADGAQLAQLFQNLIGNAIKFRGEATRRRIHVGRRDDATTVWVFTVQDNGIGIDPQYAERIFMMFQRLHDKGRVPGHRHRPGDLQEDRRPPRRAHLGGIRAGQGRDVRVHASRAKQEDSDTS